MLQNKEISTLYSVTLVYFIWDNKNVKKKENQKKIFNLGRKEKRIS